MRLHRFASDEHLVDRVRAGSASAFEALFDRHHRPLLAFCRHMLGSAADAEDAVQHTFMAAYADLMRSDKPIALRPWLYSIARDRCVSMLRARRERPVAELPEPETDHLAAEVNAREELRATLADIVHLPEDQRAALILAELGDASHAEIAQILGCRSGKVKALVYQARSSLATGRIARDTPCAEIREQLAAGGVAIRRTSLRLHVRDCDGCREYGELMRLQRRRLRILLPVAPSLGLKRAVLGSVLGSGGGAGGLTAIAGGVAATAIVSVSVASGGGSRAAPVADKPPSTPMVRAEPARKPPAAPVRSRTRQSKPVTKARRTPARTRRRAVTPAAEPSATPVATATPTASSEPGIEAVAARPPDPPGRPAEPPGHDRRATPPEPPGKPPEPPGKPPEPPGKPAEPPGRPAEPPGRPAEPPGRPAEPPGRPAEPPGRAAGPPAGGKPAEPPGRPAGPPAGGKPAAAPGNPDPGPPERGPEPPHGPGGATSDPEQAPPRR